jgi:hypothetical protein
MEKGMNKTRTDAGKMVELIGHLGDLKQRLSDIGDQFTKICIDLDGDATEALSQESEPMNEKLDKREGIFWELHRLTLQCNILVDRLYRIRGEFKKVI